MKTVSPPVFWPVLLTGLFVLATCINTQTGGTVLDKAESLVWADPDSAIRLLSSVPHTTLSPDARARYGVLWTHAHIRSGRSLSSDTLLEHSFWHYRSSSSNPPGLMSALYCRGMLSADSGKIVPAVESFTEAVSLSVLANGDTRILSLTHSNLARLYLMQALPAEALHHYEASASLNRSAHRTEWLANDLSYAVAVASHIDTLRAAAIGIELEALLPDCPDSIRHHIHHNLGLMHLRTGSTARAEHHLLRSLDLKFNSRTCRLLATVYERTGQPELADSLYRLSFHKEDVYSMVRVHRLLYHRYAATGLVDSAWFHLEEYLRLKDSIYRHKDTEAIYRIHQSFEWNRFFEQYHQVLFLSTGIILLLLSLLYLFSWVNRKDLTRLAARIGEWQNKVRQVVTYRRHLSGLLMKEYLSYRQQLTEQGKQTENYRSEVMYLKGTLAQMKMMVRSLEREHIGNEDLTAFAYYLRTLRDGFVYDAVRDREGLHFWTDIKYKGYATRLFKVYKRLTPTQRDICCFLRDGKNLSDIAVLLRIEEETVRRYTVRMYPILRVKDRDGMMTKIMRGY